MQNDSFFAQMSLTKQFSRVKSVKVRNPLSLPQNAVNYEDVRGDVLRPPHGTTPAAVKLNYIFTFR